MMRGQVWLLKVLQVYLMLRSVITRCSNHPAPLISSHNVAGS